MNKKANTTLTITTIIGIVLIMGIGTYFLFIYPTQQSITNNIKMSASSFEKVSENENYEIYELSFVNTGSVKPSCGDVDSILGVDPPYSQRFKYSFYLTNEEKTINDIDYNINFDLSNVKDKTKSEFIELDVSNFNINPMTSSCSGVDTSKESYFQDLNGYCEKIDDKTTKCEVSGVIRTESTKIKPYWSSGYLTIKFQKEGVIIEEISDTENINEEILEETTQENTQESSSTSEETTTITKTIQTIQKEIPNISPIVYVAGIMILILILLFIVLFFIRRK